MIIESREKVVKQNFSMRNKNKENQLTIIGNIYIEETGMERPVKLGKKPVSPVFLDGILWIVMLKIDKFRHKSAKHIA